MADNAWAERLQNEADALSTNIEKLSSFIEEGAWCNLPVEDQNLLIEQRNHMTAYLGVLQRRLARAPAP